MTNVNYVTSDLGERDKLIVRLNIYIVITCSPHSFYNTYVCAGATIYVAQMISSSLLLSEQISLPLIA